MENNDLIDDYSIRIFTILIEKMEPISAYYDGANVFQFYINTEKSEKMAEASYDLADILLEAKRKHKLKAFK